jgi:hypothetical protein
MLTNDQMRIFKKHKNYRGDADFLLLTAPAAQLTKQCFLCDSAVKSFNLFEHHLKLSFSHLFSGYA